MVVSGMRNVNWRCLQMTRCPWRSRRLSLYKFAPNAQLRSRRTYLKRLPFDSIHRHGFIRVAAGRPAVVLADPSANAEAAIDRARAADAAGADLLVLPELCLSGYALDDLFLQDALLEGVDTALAAILAASINLRPVLLIGAPLRRGGSVYNCAVVIARGCVLGVVPKSYLPNYREYYEKRWFASGVGMAGLDIKVADRAVPFGCDLLFAADSLPGFTFHAEICEDFWAPLPPSTAGALAGALILCNLSASNIVIGKADERDLLCKSHAMRCLAAYIYSASGHGESTTDLAWDGQSLIVEMGQTLATSDRFDRNPAIILADIDVARLRSERTRTGTFNDCGVAAGHPEQRFRRIGFDHPVHEHDVGLIRAQRRFPYVPDRPERLAQDCYEAFNIQVDGLVRRLEATRAKTMVIGISGGLDSTHALIVAAKACDLTGRPRSSILGYTLPGFATSEGTKANAWQLMRAMGIQAAEIDIKPAASQMLADIDHGFSKGEPLYDVTFENVQAGLRTDYLFRLANHHHGFVIGTGDLSELALGWCTYGVGDQMSHYAVNSGVPKTLIQYLIRWTVETQQFNVETGQLLSAILDTEISPELVPAIEDGVLQSTEAKIGPYALHDFFLFHLLRHGMSPDKVAFLAHQAWKDPANPGWPAGYPDEDKRGYDLAEISHWLEQFLKRFFTNQYKRSAIPNGPKVSAGGSLSPRGDWRMPSDAVPDQWLSTLQGLS